MVSDPVTTYFGLWSATDVQKVSDLLSRLDVRFETNEFVATEEVLKEWRAWDANSPKPNAGFDRWIYSDDLHRIGDRLVDMFPERKFGA